MELIDLSILSTSVQNRYRESFKPEDCTLPSSFKSYFQKFNYNDVIEYFEYSLVVHASSSLDIYIPNQWIYIAYYFVEYYNMLKAYRDKVLSLLSKEDVKSCANNEERSRNLLSRYDGKDKEYLIKFLSDYTWWGGGKTIDRNDYYVSPILSIAGLVNASQSYVADICKNLAESEMAFHALDDFINVSKKEYTSKRSCSIALQQIYYGAPGTGKSYTIDKITTEENSVRTTFHPDSDYASFVGAYKPTMENLPVSAIVGKEVHEAVPQGNHTGKEKKIVYKYVPQAFLKAYVKAWGDLENPYYLIIEEINRGNCAQIFGDLFQLLDRNNMGASSYPILADEDITRFLNEDENGFAGLSEQQKNQISDFVLIKDSGERRDIGEDILKGKHLLLPPNLYIWATMNTSDQSLFPIDSAFKRRWDWEYMPIDYNPIDTNKKTPLNWKLKIGENLYDWGTFLSKINPEIETLTESSDKQMGYFFVKANPLTGIISEEVFKNKVLFYLWTEVLKDFDMGKDPFINPETKKTFKFTDFFDSNQKAVVNFIDNLKLEPLSVITESIDEEDEELEDIEDIEETNDNISSIQYSINDGVPFKKTYLGLETLKAFITLKPDLSPSEIIEMWKASVKKPKHLIEDEDGYLTFIEKSKGNRKKNEKRFEPFEYKGTKLYLWKGWGDGDQDNITPFMNIINDLDWGIKIKRVNETLD